ncbi:MAG: hypothetical protein ABJD07_12505 [Gemmatimonadaceae bacterium]
MTDPNSPIADDASRRFLDAFAEVHPANYDAIVRAAAADPEYQDASRLVMSLSADSPDATHACESFPANIARVTTAARERMDPADASDTARIEAIALGAMLALLLRRAVYNGAPPRAFDVAYRPFAGVIPFNTVVLPGDASAAPPPME